MGTLTPSTAAHNPDGSGQGSGLFLHCRKSAPDNLNEACGVGGKGGRARLNARGRRVHFFLRSSPRTKSTMIRISVDIAPPFRGP